MEERLQSKVQSLRSQGLTFAKDGFDVCLEYYERDVCYNYILQFTLDVPDTGDVKSIFSTMGM